MRPAGDHDSSIVFEIDLTNESVGKFSIYAAFGVGEIWHCSEDTFRFLRLEGSEYRETRESASFPGLTPAMLTRALEESRTVGQTAALKTSRERWRAASRTS